MRASLVAIVAGSAIAFGLAMGPAQALAPGGRVAGPEGLLTVQHKETGTMKPGHARRHVGKRGPKEPPSQGFLASCQWLRARALTSHNPVWWRKYRQCVAKP